MCGLAESGARSSISCRLKLDQCALFIEVWRWQHEQTSLSFWGLVFYPKAIHKALNMFDQDVQFLGVCLPWLAEAGV